MVLHLNGCIRRAVENGTSSLERTEAPMLFQRLQRLASTSRETEGSLDADM